MEKPEVVLLQYGPLLISLLFGFLMSILTWTFKRVLKELEDSIKEHRALFTVHQTTITEVQSQLIIIGKNFETVDSKLNELKESAKESSENTKILIRAEGDIRLLEKNLEDVLKIKKDVDNQYNFIRDIEKKNIERVEEIKRETVVLRKRDHFFINKMTVIKSRMEKLGSDFGDTDWTMPNE